MEAVVEATAAADNPALFFNNPALLRNKAGLLRPYGSNSFLFICLFTYLFVPLSANIMYSMRQTLMILLLAGAMTTAAQVKTEIKAFNQAGPYAVSAPLGLDTVNVKGQKFDETSLMSSIALTSPVT